MTIYYVDSASASEASPYDTWAKAAHRLDTIAGIDAAGDTIYVKSTHSETLAGAVTMAWAGTIAAPTRIICVTGATEPPVAADITTGAVVATTTAVDLTPASTGYVSLYGITFRAGDSTNASDIVLTNSTSWVVYDACAIELAGNSGNSDIQCGTSTTVLLNNCTIKTINSASRISVNIAKMIIRGGSIASGTLANPLFDSGTAGNVLIEGFNMENLPSNANLFGVTGPAMQAVVRNCKLPATWTSGSVFSGTVGPGSTYALHNCASGDTNYALELKTEYGAITHDTAIYRTAGASDGTTNISWKMVSVANAEWMHQTLDSPEIVRWNATTGSAITVTLELIIDTAVSLTNQDVWMEVQYLGTSGFPLSLFDIDSRAATYLTASAGLSAGTGLGNWTGDSGNGNSYKLVSTITPQEKGFIHVVVKLAKASTTIYVCPKLEVA